jgi:hypothetical protein
MPATPSFTPAHGKNSCVYVNAFDLSDFFRTVEFGRTKDVIDATTFRRRSKRFVGGFPDASLSAEGLWDDADDAIDDVLDAAISADAESNWMWFPGGDAFGRVGYGALAIETNYTPSGGVDDVVAAAIEAQPTTGRERLQSLQAKSTILLAASPVTGAELDSGLVGGTALGGAAYLQVFEVAGTGSVDVEVHMSSDSFAADDDTLVTFGSVVGASGVVTSANDAQRIELALDAQVDQSVRVELTITTLTSVVLVVGFHRQIVVAT